MWREPFPFLPPAEAARRLAPLGGLSFLDSAAPHPELGRVSLVAAAPFAEFTASLADTRFAGRPVAGDPFAALDALLARFRVEPVGEDEAPGCGAIGFLAFEAAHLLEALPRPEGLTDDTPLVSLGFYDTAIRFDLEAGTASIESAGFGPDLDRDAPMAAREHRARRRIAAFRARLEAPAPRPPRPSAEPLRWRSSHDGAAYAAMVERVRELIAAGDLFQANVARRVEAALPPGFDAFGFHGVLRRVNPAPFAAFLARPDREIASASPELFLRLRNGRVETRPIKGTARRPVDPQADAAAARALLASPKDRAENVMIVDLMRNDLSRVCEPASVAVPALCALESVTGVHHLASTVTGRLREGLGPGALLAAAFPAGSITGAPKIRACEAIAALEGRARGVYCGSLAALGFNGAADLSVAIRTVEVRGGTAAFGVGGGVTILSVGTAEWEETRTKAAGIEAAFRRFAQGGPA